MSVVASQQLLHIFSKFAWSSMCNSIEGHPLTLLKNPSAHLYVAFDQSLVWFCMVFNFTTKLFNTNPPKLWPINTRGWCHSYLHRTYSFAVLIFQGILNWLLHFILVKSIFMCDWNISWSAHLWHYSKKLFHTPTLRLSSWHFQNLKSQSPFHFQNQAF
jgi:hypothetical protein